MPTIEPHAISGSQKAITPARSKLARSGATRSAWPLVVGARATLYALSTIARSGATRSNYTSGRGFVSVGGVHVGTIPASASQKIVGGVTINDALNEQPNRCTFRVRGLVPAIGADVIVTIGSKNNGDRLFAGQVLTTSQGYTDTPLNFWHDVSAIDWTWGLNQRLVAQRWTGASASQIAIDLVTAGAPNYGTKGIAANLPTLDEFTTTNEEVASALTALAKRVGGYWYVDYNRQVHLFVGKETGETPPSTLNAAHQTLFALVVDRDGSQLVTRVYIEAGGSTAMGRIVAGETIIPVATLAWYDAGGGVVVSGPQRIRYSGVQPGGAGSLVGPGAAPVVAPAGAVVSGTGIDPGVHEYAVSYVTAAGESLPGPRLPLTVGTIAPPPAALTIGSQLLGAGPDPGVHRWAVSFLTATGETLIGPFAEAVVQAAPVPLTAPTPGAPGFGGGLEQGTYYYAVTFVTASGETTIGPSSGPVTMVNTSMAPPAAAPAWNPPTIGGNLAPGTYQYAVAFQTSQGSTTAGPVGAPIDMISVGPLAAPTTAPTATSGGGPFTARYRITFVDAAGGETTAGPSSSPIQVASSGSSVTVSGIQIGPAGTVGRRIYETLVFERRVKELTDNTTTTTTILTDQGPATSPPATNTANVITSAIPLTQIPIGPTGTTKRAIYRTTSGSNLRLVATLNNNSATTYTDTTATENLGGPPPATNTTGAWTNSVPLTGIPVGPAGTTQRNLYRSTGGPYAFLVAIGNNSQTSYTDTASSASLGAAPPTVNTAGQRQIQVSQIPIGGADVTGRRIYRTRAGQTTPYGLALELAGNAATTATDTTTDGALGAAPPATATAIAARVSFTSIPIGPASVTARKLYRTKAGQSALLLLATFADNTTATYTDAAADASLGAAPPGADTSGLPQPTGAVNAGATVLIVAGAAAFQATGGWAVIGNGQQVIRYTGISGNALTGIPPAGPGAITASIAYNSSVTVAPALTGIPAAGAGQVLYPIAVGDDVNQWIQVDDLAAQAAIAALFTSAAGGAHSGIIEDVIQDRRLSATEARARGRAHLQQRKDIQIRIRYRTRDINSRSGRPITVNLLTVPYALSATFMIQTVRIEHTTPDLLPMFDVDASSERFSFEDLLRRFRDLPEG